jgi:hypothetical protein
MAKRVPANAFDTYFRLGRERSYQQIADYFGVSKKTVVALAKSQGWQERVMRMEQDAARKSDSQAVEDLATMRDRHLKMIQVVQGKALEALKSMPINNAHQAVQALMKAIEQERLVRGEPTDRTVLSIEETVKNEYERWLMRGTSDELGYADEGDTE